MKFETITDFRTGRTRFIQQMNEIKRRANAGELTAAEAREAQALAQEAVPLGQKLDTVENMIRAAERTLGTSLGGMGFLPALVAPPAILAAIVAVSYLLGKMIDKTSSFLERSNYIRQRIGQGASAAQALSEYEQNTPEEGGLFGDVSKLAWPIAIVLGAFLLLRR